MWLFLPLCSPWLGTCSTSLTDPRFFSHVGAFYQNSSNMACRLCICRHWALGVLRISGVFPGPLVEASACRLDARALDIAAWLLLRSRTCQLKPVASIVSTLPCSLLYFGRFALVSASLLLVAGFQKQLNIVAKYRAECGDRHWRESFQSCMDVVNIFH